MDIIGKQYLEIINNFIMLYLQIKYKYKKPTEPILKFQDESSEKILYNTSNQCGLQCVQILYDYLLVGLLFLSLQCCSNHPLSPFILFHTHYSCLKFKHFIQSNGLYCTDSVVTICTSDQNFFYRSIMR